MFDVNEEQEVSQSIVRKHGYLNGVRHGDGQRIKSLSTGILTA